MTTTTNTTRTMVLLSDGTVVERVKIIGCDLYAYSAHQPARFCETHGSLSHFDVPGKGETLYGQMGSEILPAELDKLPARSQERLDAVRAWVAAKYQAAYAAILRAFPEAAGGKRQMGMIEVWR